MSTNHKPFAIVIEPRAALADIVCDVLEREGYEVVAATTHVGGAEKALLRGKVDMAIAAVPAPGEDRSGSYLSEARRSNPDLCMVIMLSDPLEVAESAPHDAQVIVKPFSVKQLEQAIARARAPRHGRPVPR